MVVVSGFLPVPLPMMIPFMGAQSLVIGKMFGEGFQYGKRKISAMPNEEFNALTFQNMMSNARDEMQASIPTMQAALHDMQPLVETVVKEFFDYIKQIAAMLPEQSRQLTGGGELLTGSTGPQGTKTLNLTKAERDYLVKQSAQSGDLLGDILEKLGLDRFGQSAHGTDQTATLSFPSTIAGLSVGQAQQQARDKQKAFELKKQREDIAKQHIRFKQQQLAKQLPPSKVIVPQGRFGAIGTKKQAGQSQIMARKAIISKIANAAQNMNQAVQVSQMAKFKGIMEMWQQRLINLLARYRF